MNLTNHILFWIEVACGKMNREWADKNKAAQSKLKKDSFVDGIHEYIELRKCLMQEMLLCNTIY